MTSSIRINIISHLILPIALVFSCAKDKTATDCEIITCTPTSVSYEDDIVPLIVQSCATNIGPLTGCHDAWIFEYDNVKSAVDKGVFWSSIADKSMPKTPNLFNIEALTEAEYEMFQCWICNGAPEN